LGPNDTGKWLLSRKLRGIGKEESYPTQDEPEAGAGFQRKMSLEEMAH